MPTVVRVRTAKSAVASYHLLHAHFVGWQTAIVEIALTSDRAPRHLSGLADTKVEQHCHRYGHYDEYELHGSSPIGQLALNVRSEAVPPISSEIKARRFTAPKPPALPTKRIAHLSTSGDCGFGPNSTELAQARMSVSYRIVGSAISGPQLTQEPKLLARKSPSRRYRRPSGATSPAANRRQ